MVVTNAFLMNAYHHGLGRHIYYLTAEEESETFKWLWAAEPTNLFAVYLVRLSIALFLLRLVPPKKVYIWLIWSMIAALTISDIFVSIYYFFECRPLHKVWVPSTPGSCFDRSVTKGATWLYQGEIILVSMIEQMCVGPGPLADNAEAVSIPADIVFIAVPICLFWRLQVKLRTKIVLIFTCGLGIL